MALRITGLGEEIAAVTGLPWHINLEEWPEDPALTEKRGISRHIVRLVRSTDDPDAEVYAVKETVSEFANREYKALRELAHLGAPSVQPIAVIEGRTDESQTGYGRGGVRQGEVPGIGLEPIRLFLVRGV